MHKYLASGRIGTLNTDYHLRLIPVMLEDLLILFNILYNNFA